MSKPYNRKAGQDLGSGIEPDFLDQRPERIQDDVDVIIYGNENLKQLYNENENEFNAYLDEVGEEYFD